MSDSYKIYQYVFPDGKTYIGMTKNTVKERRDQGYQHNKPLKNALREFGWKRIKLIILASGLSKEDACEAEKKYIIEYKSNDPNCGYNISGGGKSTFAGLKHSGAYRKHMSDLYKGRKFSNETLLAMKTAHKNERKAVIQYDLAKNKQFEFESLSDAAESVGGYKSNISRACREKKIYKQSLWAFKGGDDR